MLNFLKENKRLVKKICATFVFPILLGLTGSIIFLSAGWNLLTQTYSIGTAIFAQNSVSLDQVSFNINNKEVYRPDIGTVFATLRIPELGIEKEVIHGDSPTELRKGVGHYAGSTLPGEGGNCVFDGHRDTVFKKLKDAKKGQTIFVDTDWGTYEYKIKSTRITTPDDTTVLEPTDFEKLTIYTCYPFEYIGSAPERFIIEAEFVKVHDN